MNGLPVRDSDDAVMGSWVEFVIERHGERTYTNTFFTSLEVTAANVAAIARAGRARWKIENEGFNCLARHGYNLKRNFGHGRHGLANLLATLNLFAFALHAVLDCVSELWRQGRACVGPRHKFFANGVVLLRQLDGAVRDRGAATSAPERSPGSRVRAVLTQSAASQ